MHLGGQGTGAQRPTEGMEGVVREVLRRERMAGANEGGGIGCAESKAGVGKWICVGGCTERLSLCALAVCV